MKKYLFFWILGIASLFGIEKEPWFGSLYEFNFLGTYSYSRFPRVQGAYPQLLKPFNENLFYGDLEFCFTPNWDIDMDLQFADDTAVSFSFRTLALQVRYLWLDDIIGDMVSLTTGFSSRYTSRRGLSDVSCPSYANADFEVNLAIGREFDCFRLWRFRLWGYGAVGKANRGSPWINGIIGFEGNRLDKHKWGIFFIGSEAYGRYHTLNPFAFNGYAKIRERYIDLAFRYGYGLGAWGTIRLEYVRRMAAKLCPEDVNTFLIGYLLPFSF